MISDDDINNLGELARLSLSLEEKTRFRGEISNILSYVEEINSAETDAVGVVYENVNLMREDVVSNEPGRFTEALLEAAPDRKGNLLKVPKILGNDE